ncbi:MAG: response regulator transcription factor [Chloroflexota bacterium]
MLTARDAVTDRVNGLDAGADDYLTKPFATEELLARVRALDVARHEVRRGDRSIELTPKDFEVLEFLMRHAGKVVTRDQILRNLWRDARDSNSKAVDLLTDPPTSPNRRGDQVWYGVIAGLVAFAAQLLGAGQVYLLFGVLAANIWLAVRRWQQRRPRVLPPRERRRARRAALAALQAVSVPVSVRAA